VVCNRFEACGHSPSFGYRGETCELGAHGYSKLGPMVTVINLGVLSCLDVV
jgi:hypothetical protein